MSAMSVHRGDQVNLVSHMLGKFVDHIRIEVSSRWEILDISRWFSTNHFNSSISCSERPGAGQGLNIHSPSR